MATSTEVNATLIKYDASGNQTVIYPKTNATNVTITSNSNYSTTNLQTLITALGSLAFRSYTIVTSVDNAASGTLVDGSVISTMNETLTSLKTEVSEMSSVGSGQFAIYKAHLTKTSSTTSDNGDNLVGSGSYLYIDYDGSMHQASSPLSSASFDRTTVTSDKASGTVPGNYVLVSSSGSGGYTVDEAGFDVSEITALGFTYYGYCNGGNNAVSYPVTTGWSWSSSGTSVYFYIMDRLYFYNGTKASIPLTGVTYSYTTAYYVNYVVCDVGTTPVNG